MQKLSLIDTQELVNSYVKTFGQSGAAKKLTNEGYRSPEGAPILQAHVFRILHGSSTCLLAPETENQQHETPITEEQPAAIPKRTQQLAAEQLFADEELLEREIIKTGEELRQELLEEEADLQEMESALPSLVPCVESRPYREARHLERYVRVSGVFSPRSPIELDEDKDFFGIPRLKLSSPVIKSKPYQKHRYGQNVITTRDLTVREK